MTDNVSEMDSDRLLQTCVEVWSRSIRNPDSEKMHNGAFELKDEVAKRLQHLATIRGRVQGLQEQAIKQEKHAMVEMYQRIIIGEINAYDKVLALLPKEVK